MALLQVPPTSIIHKMAIDNPTRVTPYRILFLHISVGGNVQWDRICMKYLEISENFPEGAECPL